MPKHFLYVMDPTAKAPAGDGDTGTWFWFYKWKVEGEVFVPRRAPGFIDAAPGDFIWFAEERFSPTGGFCPHVFGGAQILRIEEEHRLQEIWYRGDDLYELNPAVTLDGPAYPQVITQEIANQWLTKATRSSP